LSIVQNKEICINLPFAKGGYLLIEKDVISEMYNYRQSKTKIPESGGCLLGYFRPPHIHITKITSPQKGDKQSRVRYHRKDKRHLSLINEFTHKTSTGTYIGEWHTHPEINPSPSSIDTFNWRKIQSTRRPTNTIFLIVGTSEISIYSSK